MLINKANLDAIFFSWSTRYQKGYDIAPSFRDKVASEEASAGSETHYGWIGQLPGMRKWTGERVVKNLQARGYVLANEKYEDTIGVPRDKIEDDQIGVYGNYVEALGRSAKVWGDQLVAAAILAGTTAACFDGQPVFHNSHPQDMDDAGSATYQNNFDATGTGGGVARPLTHDNFRLVVETMMAYKGDNGIPFGINPNTLFVGPSNRTRALQVVKADLIAPSATFGAEASAGPQTNVFAGEYSIVVTPFITDASWYVLDTTKPIMPFVFQVRNAAEFTFLNRPDDQSSFLRDEWLFGVRARGAAGYSLPFLAARAL